MKNRFYTGEITKITGVKKDRLTVWLMNHYITPSVVVADGHGSRNIFNLIDVYCIELLKQLISMGMSRELSARIVEGWIRQAPLVGDVFERAKELEYCWLNISKIGDVYEPSIEVSRRIPLDVTLNGAASKDMLVRERKVEEAVDAEIRINLKRLIVDVDSRITQ